MTAENASSDREFSSAAHFGYAVVLRRTMLGLKRRQLAELSDLSYPYISEIEKGSKEPSAKSLRGLATALGFNSVSEMMAWVEEQPPQRGLASADQRGPEDQPEINPVRSALTGESGSGLYSGRQSLRSSRSRGSEDELNIAVERAIRRVFAGVVDELRREVERIVEEEVARRLGEDGSNW